MCTTEPARSLSDGAIRMNRMASDPTTPRSSFGLSQATTAFWPHRAHLPRTLDGQFSLRRGRRLHRDTCAMQDQTPLLCAAQRERVTRRSDSGHDRQ